MKSVLELTDYMGFQGLLDDEEKLVRETARTFVNEQVLPIIDEHAQNETFPQHLVPIMGEMGFFGPSLPVEYGELLFLHVPSLGLLHANRRQGESA